MLHNDLYIAYSAQIGSLWANSVQTKNLIKNPADHDNPFFIYSPSAPPKLTAPEPIKAIFIVLSSLDFFASEDMATRREIAHQLGLCCALNRILKT